MGELLIGLDLAAVVLAGVSAVGLGLDEFGGLGTLEENAVLVVEDGWF